MFSVIECPEWGRMLTIDHLFWEQRPLDRFSTLVFLLRVPDEIMVGPGHYMPQPIFTWSHDGVNLVVLADNGTATYRRYADIEGDVYMELESWEPCPYEAWSPLAREAEEASLR